MLQFFCDYCRNAKQLEEVWINGIAAENIGTHAARRDVIIDPAWRYERAVQPFAVHFCSVECKNSFLAELFQAPPSVLEVERVEVLPAAVATVVHARKKPVSGYTRKRKTVASLKRACDRQTRQGGKGALVTDRFVCQPFFPFLFPGCA